jgi:Protein of unknown function (DUF3631)
MEATEEDKPPLDGAAILDEAVRFFRRFSVLPSPAYYDICAAWAAGTHVYQAFQDYPRLGFLSDRPQSGKTRGMTMTCLLSAKPKKLTNYSAAVLVRWMNKGRTLALDETDTIFRTDRSAPLMQAALNDGFNFKGVSDKCSGGDDVTEKPIYCPVMFGGLRVLPPATMSRSIPVYMEQRKPEQRIEPYLARLHDPQGEAIGQALGDWAGSVAAELGEAWPDLPDGCEDRTADCWWSLFAIADVAGGDWPDRMRAAYAEVTKGVTAEPEMSPLARLLKDVRAAWPAGDRIGSAELVRRLYALQGAPWATWWPAAVAPREMAAMLRGAGIEPCKIRLPGRAPVQGYYRDDFAKVWDVPEHVPDEFAS